MNLSEYTVVGEFDEYPKGDTDAGRPRIIQSWLPDRYITDPDPEAKGKVVWCVSLAGGKCVQLRKGDKVVVLRKPV
jgi:hypothetical protein